MMLFHNRRWLTAVCLAIGWLQAWDSGVLKTAPWIQILVAMAVAAPPCAWGARLPYGVQAVSVAVAFVILTIARVAASVPLPTLHLAVFPAAVLVFVLRGVETRTRGVEG
jgi:hypothetical protein